MRAVGEVMSIGKTYKKRSKKAIRSLETGRYGLGWAKKFRFQVEGGTARQLAAPSSERQFIMYEALRKGATVEELWNLTKIKHYFIGADEGARGGRGAAAGLQGPGPRRRACCARPSWTASPTGI